MKLKTAGKNARIVK